MLQLLACNSGSYGLGCSESCGQCLDGDKCLNTNGTCLTGCSAGYRGHTCDKRAYMMYWLQCKAIKRNILKDQRTSLQ